MIDNPLAGVTPKQMSADRLRLAARRKTRRVQRQYCRGCDQARPVSGGRRLRDHQNSMEKFWCKTCVRKKLHAIMPHLTADQAEQLAAAERLPSLLLAALVG